MKQLESINQKLEIIEEAGMVIIIMRNQEQVEIQQNEVEKETPSFV
jgi:hypothetical protein